MRMAILAGAAAAGLLVLPSAALPKHMSQPAEPSALSDVVACRAIDDAARRLACFDRSVGVLAAATDRKDIVVADRAQLREARRSLFGFTMPSLKVFGIGDKESDPADAELNTTLRSAGLDADGRWLLVLEDGGVWRQIDDKPVAAAPHPGAAVRITHGAMGSFFVHIGSQSGFKARRES